MSQPISDTPEPVGRKSTINLENYSKSTRETYQALVELGESIIGEGTARYHAGSGSIQLVNKVIAKILPQLEDGRESLLLGISTDYAPQTWKLSLPAFDGPFLVNESLFHFFPLSSEPKLASEQAKTAFGELKSRL